MRVRWYMAILAGLLWVPVGCIVWVLLLAQWLSGRRRAGQRVATHARERGAPPDGFRAVMLPVVVLHRAETCARWAGLATPEDAIAVALVQMEDRLARRYEEDGLERRLLDAARN